MGTGKAADSLSEKEVVEKDHPIETSRWTLLIRFAAGQRTSSRSLRAETEAMGTRQWLTEMATRLQLYRYTGCANCTVQATDLRHLLSARSRTR